MFYINTHGARKPNIYLKVKRSASHIMIFTAHPFAFLVYSSLSLPHAQSIQAQTRASTQKSIVRYTNHLVIAAMSFWKLVRPVHSSVHSYFRVSGFIQLSSVIQIQVPPGISSVTTIFFGPFDHHA